MCGKAGRFTVPLFRYDLHIFMNEIEANLNRKMKQKQCKDDFKEHASDMKRNYEEVQKLIDVENLSQLEPVDLTMIRKVLDEMEHHIEKMGSLGSYDRALINPVREAFTNKNWKVDDIEQEKQIVDRIFNVINKYRTQRIFVICLWQWRIREVTRYVSISIGWLSRTCFEVILGRRQTNMEKMVHIRPSGFR